MNWSGSQYKRKEWKDDEEGKKEYILYYCEFCDNIIIA